MSSVGTEELKELIEDAAQIVNVITNRVSKPAAHVGYENVAIGNTDRCYMTVDLFKFLLMRRDDASSAPEDVR